MAALLAVPLPIFISGIIQKNLLRVSYLVRGVLVKVGCNYIGINVLVIAEGISIISCIVWVHELFAPGNETYLVNSIIRLAMRCLNPIVLVHEEEVI